MKKFETFDEWWTAYTKISSLNKQHLSFLDVNIIRKEMKLAFMRILPENKTAVKNHGPDK